MNSTYTTVDLVVPCYNEEEVLETFYAETSKVIATLPDRYRFRFLLIDDGSRDQTYLIMKKLAAEHSDVKYLSFARNFGKEAAMYAGLKNSTADLVVVMDADLQHPPALFSTFLEGIEEGHDCVAAMRTNRKGEAPIRSFFSRQFYKISNSMTDVKMAYGAVDYRMMTRQMVNSILQLTEVQRFSKGLFMWVGYDTKWIPYENVERTMGKTKWNFRGLFHYAIDGITSFSVKPLHWVSGMGIFICVMALIYIALTFAQTMIWGIDVPGYFTQLTAILFMGGIIEFSLGIIAEYISRIYMETKNRPVYILKNTNLEQSEDAK